MNDRNNDTNLMIQNKFIESDDFIVS